MSGNDSELPDDGGGDDSTRLRDRARTQFQRRAEQARQAAGRTRTAAASAAASAGSVRERAAEQLDNFSAEDLEQTDGGGVRVSDQALRERAAEQSETPFTPGDFEVVTEDGERVAQLSEPAREQLRAERGAAELDETFEDIAVDVDDVAVDGEDVSLTGDAQQQLRRQEIAEQVVESDPFVDSAQEVAVEFEDDGDVDISRRFMAGIEADQFRRLGDINAELGPGEAGRSEGDDLAEIDRVGDTVSEITDDPRTFISSGVGGDANLSVYETGDRQDLEATVTFEDGGELNNALRKINDVPTEVLESSEQVLGGSAEIREDRAARQARRQTRNAVDEALVEAGISDEFAAGATASGDVIVQAEGSGRTGSGADLDAALGEIETNRLDRARVEAAQQIDSETPGVDVRGSDLQRAGGAFELDAETQTAVEAERTERVRRDAAAQFDSQLDAVDVGADDVRLDEQGGETVAELDDATRDAVLEQQRSQARQEAAEQFDEQTQVDVTPADVTLRETDDGLEAELDAEAAGEVEQTRQDIAADITPDGSPAAADAEARFANLETRTPTVSDRLGVDRNAEPSRAADVAAEISQFLRDDVLPAGGGAAIGAAASTFRGPFDPGREAADSAVDRLEGPAEDIDDAAEAGIGISTDVTSDVVAGATPLPDELVSPAAETVEGGAEIGAESLNPARIAQDTARAPGLTLRGVDAATGEQAAENIQFGADVTAAGADLAAEEGPEFVRENPRRSAEIGIGAGIALGGGALAGTAVTRGTTGAARGARSVLGEVDISSDARRFAADDSGQLDLTFGDSDTDAPTVEIDEPDDFDPQRVTRSEVLDAPEAGPRRSDASFSQSFTQRSSAPSQRSDVPDRFGRGESAAEANPSFDARATFDAGPTISRDALAPDVDFSDAAPAVRRQADELGVVGGGAATGAAVGGGATVPPDPIDAARLEGLSDGATEDTTLSRSLGAVDVAADTQQRLERAQSAAVGVDSDVAVGPRSAPGIDTDVAQTADTRQTGRTDQLLEQDQELATSGVEVGTTTTRPVSQSTQTAPRTPTTTRLRPDVPDLPDLDGEEERAGLGLGAIGANFRNPTRTLSEADDLVTEIGGEFDGPR